MDLAVWVTSFNGQGWPRLSKQSPHLDWASNGSFSICSITFWLLSLRRWSTLTNRAASSGWRASLDSRHFTSILPQLRCRLYALVRKWSKREAFACQERYSWGYVLLRSVIAKVNGRSAGLRSGTHCKQVKPQFCTAWQDATGRPALGYCSGRYLWTKVSMKQRLGSVSAGTSTWHPCSRTQEWGNGSTAQGEAIPWSHRFPRRTASWRRSSPTCTWRRWGTSRCVHTSSQPKRRLRGWWGPFSPPKFQRPRLGTSPCAKHAIIDPLRARRWSYGTGS